MNIHKIAAEKSSTAPEDWEEISGPETGVGDEHWLTNQKAGLQAYVCVDQGQITACEITQIQK